MAQFSIINIVKQCTYVVRPLYVPTQNQTFLQSSPTFDKISKVTPKSQDRKGDGATQILSLLLRLGFCSYFHKFFK